MKREQQIQDLQGVTLVTANPERALAFYRDSLGLQVDAQNGETYRLSFPDPPGAADALTIRAQSDAEPGSIGIGGVHHVALTVESYDALLKWKRLLRTRGILVAGPYNQEAYQDIVFTDPDGVLLELATRGPGWSATANGSEVFQPPLRTMSPYRDEAAIDAMTWPHPVDEIAPDMELRGLHHVATIASALERTDQFYRDLGLSLLRKVVDSEDFEVVQWYWGREDTLPGMMVAAFPIVHPGEGGIPIHAQPGCGVVECITFAAMYETQPATIQDPDGVTIQLVGT